MKQRFVMLELPNNNKDERNILGVIKQTPSEVHDYRSILLEIQTIVASINKIRNNLIGGYTLTLQLFSEDKIHEIECNSLLQGKGDVREFATITEFAKWYKEDYSPKVIEQELKNKNKNSIKR